MPGIHFDTENLKMCATESLAWSSTQSGRGGGHVGKGLSYDVISATKYMQGVTEVLESGMRSGDTEKVVFELSMRTWWEIQSGG